MQLTAAPGNETAVRYTADGRWIAFDSDRHGKKDIYISEVATGETTRLTSSAHSESRPAWSPDGLHIAFQSDQEESIGVWVMSRDGDNQRRLTDPSSYAGAPDWSPDGSKIVYQGDAAGNMDIWVVPAAGGEATQITDHPDTEWHPRWSADGKSIVFYTSWGDAMTDIWISNLETDALTQITSHPAEDYRPAWSPDGRWLTFISNRGERSDLWAVPAAGGEPFQLTDDERYRDYLTWSPDGEAIAFSTLDNAAIFSVPATGGAPSRLSDVELDPSEPTYAPDDRAIAFIARNKREQNVWIMPADGGAHVLAGINEFQESPAWSPDGKFIAFVQGKGGDARSGNLWIAPTDGGPAKQITQIGYVAAPVWCRDGRTIVIAAGEDELTGQLWRVDLESETLTKLIDLPKPARPSDCLPGGEVAFTTELDNVNRVFTISLDGGEPAPFEIGLEGEVEGARWSPDGKQIAFLSNDSLHVIASAGGRAARVEGIDSVASWPSWSADGASLLFTMREGGYDIWRLAVASLLAEKELLAEKASERTAPNAAP